ncbi:hypothetical protein [Actinotalea ferrariae]|nr:hypothetical protein [Actinotalea ferrariae]
MTDRDDLPGADQRAGATPDEPGATTPEDAPAAPPVHERWWWTGTFRAVLGGVVVGYQWPVLTSGEATVWNWVLAAVGAAIVVVGAWLVLSAYRRRG